MLSRGFLSAALISTLCVLFIRNAPLEHVTEIRSARIATHTGYCEAFAADFSRVASGKWNVSYTSEYTSEWERALDTSKDAKRTAQRGGRFPSSSDLWPPSASLQRQDAAKQTEINFLYGIIKVPRLLSRECRRLGNVVHKSRVNTTVQGGFSAKFFWCNQKQEQIDSSAAVIRNFPSKRKLLRTVKDQIFLDSFSKNRPAHYTWEMGTGELPLYSIEGLYNSVSSQQGTAMGASQKLAQLSNTAASSNTTKQTAVISSAPWTAHWLFQQDAEQLESSARHTSESQITEWPINYSDTESRTELLPDVATASSTSPLHSSLESAVELERAPWASTFLRPGDDILFPGQYTSNFFPLYKTNSTFGLQHRQQQHQAGSKAVDIEVAEVVTGTLPALATYYKRLGDIYKTLQFVGNLTQSVNNTLGVNTVTNWLQANISPKVRDRIVAMTPPYLFGRVQNVFWSTVIAGWNAWVDSWKDFMKNPPFPVGVKLREAREWVHFFNDLTDWFYWGPFALIDTMQNATISYVDVALAAKEQQYKLRDILLTTLLEKQVLFYAPIFHVGIAATQYIDYFKQKGFERLDNVTAPLTNTVLITNQLLINMKDFGNIGYGSLQVCALNPICCVAPSRCFPIIENNFNKYIDLTPGFIGY